MTVSLEKLPGEFVLSGGHLKRSMIGTGMTTVGALSFVHVKKGEQWLCWFTTGCGVQQSPLKEFKVFHNIREQVRAEIQKCIAAARKASADEPVQDLADDLGLDVVGIAASTLKGNNVEVIAAINSKNLMFIPAVINVPMAVAGAAADWVAAFVAENSKSVRMELNKPNLENLFKAVAFEAAERASVAVPKVAIKKKRRHRRNARDLVHHGERCTNVALTSSPGARPN